MRLRLALGGALLLGLARPAWAGPEAAQAADVQLALLAYSGGNFRPRSDGLSRLAWALRQRTSVAVSLQVAEVQPERSALFAYPALFWQGEAPGTPLGADARAALRDYVLRGGSLWIDVSDGQAQGGFARWARHELARMLPEHGLSRIPGDHVLYKSFYLVDRHGGRVPNQAFIEGIVLEGRLAVVLFANDLAGALAQGAFGEWTYDVGPEGQALREMSLRLGVNWLMYTLCLDYKEDQVHLPFILQRRR